MKKGIYILGMLLILIGACKSDEFLDTTPYGVAVDTPGAFFRNQDDALLAINATYRNLRQRYAAFAGDYGYGNIGTDDAWKGGGNPADNESLAQKENYTITPTIGEITDRWGQSYQGILNANKVLENVPGIDMDEALKTRIIGEAYFLRAVYYMDLAKWFGGVPIYPKNLVTPAEYLDVPRSTEEETWAFVEENLLEALSRLPKKSEYEAADIGRATQGAALGFLVRANALQNDLPQVKQYSEQLFDLGEYSLAPTYKEIWQSTGENGPGSIFEVQFTEAGQGWGSITLGSASGTAFGPRQGNDNYAGWGFVQARQELLDEFETDDPRLDHSLFFVPNQEYGPLDADNNAYFGKKVAYAPFTDYPIPAVPTDGSNNWRVLRLADIYLMYAESIYQSDPNTAMEYVNRIRQRAREGNNALLPDITGLSGQVLLDAIYHERRVELNLEGLRFHDLIRTNRKSILEQYGFQVGKNEKMPIPQAEIDNYGGRLPQNEGYSN